MLGFATLFFKLVECIYFIHFIVNKNSNFILYIYSSKQLSGREIQTEFFMCYQC